MDPTTDPRLKSFIKVEPDSHFPIQNLPFGVFKGVDNGCDHACIAIGDYVVDLAALEDEGWLCDLGFQEDDYTCLWFLNELMKLEPTRLVEIRNLISNLLRHDQPKLRDNPSIRDRVVLHKSEIQMVLPASIGNYTDFYSSREHATNVGTMIRGADNALQPNWLHLPVGYHGRASSLVVSGTDVRRPRGQTKPPDAANPVFGPSKSLDFELEMGVFVGQGNQLGEPIPIERAHEHMFGMVLVNDWSARDIQTWEYVPLGPFLAKNFATSISPWVVPMAALAPFRVPGPTQDPEVLPYLRSQRNWAYDIHLEVSIQGKDMPKPHVICRSNMKHLYWNVCQQLAHHTVNGCNMQPGDLFASGTISGPTPDSFGSMLELSWKGTKPIPMPDGTTRTFLQDGDRVTMTGWCEGDGYRIGFGEVTGVVLPAINP